MEMSSHTLGYLCSLCFSFNKKISKRHYREETVYLHTFFLENQAQTSSKTIAKNLGNSEQNLKKK